MGKVFSNVEKIFYIFSCMKENYGESFDKLGDIG